MHIRFSSRKGCPSSPVLDRKRQDIQEKESQLRREKKELERFINEAPKQQQRVRHSGQRIGSPLKVIDKYSYQSTMSYPNLGQRSLRNEKWKGLGLFLFLAVVLGLIVAWICRLLL